MACGGAQLPPAARLSGDSAGVKGRPVRSGGAGAHGSAAQGRARAARGEHGGGGAMNERGNNRNTQEQGEHELHRLTSNTFL